MQASAQVPYYDFKKFQENNRVSLVTAFDNSKMPKDPLEKILEKINQNNKIHALGN